MIGCTGGWPIFFLVPLFIISSVVAGVVFLIVNAVVSKRKRALKRIDQARFVRLKKMIKEESTSI
jgi:Ni/Fe-hydrogenase subunit HybB-like protein